MIKCSYLFFTAILFCAFFCERSVAQAIPGDSASKKNAIDFYRTSLGDQAPIFTGPEYYFYNPHIKGTAYFLDTNSFSHGSVHYDGILYDDISMLYDLNLDQVAVLLPHRISKLILMKDKVKSFDFLNNHFININADTLRNNTVIKSGYYDQLYNGKMEVLARYSKSIQTTSSTTGVEDFFSQSKDYYIKKNNVYHSVGGQGSLLDILKDKKKELKQYIKANKIKYRSNPEEAMVRIASYYDHLTN